MKICYFGIFDPEFGRNRIYIEALKREGHIITLCQDSGRGLSKYWRLWQKHREIRDDYDFMIVGYPGHIIVPLARMLSNKLVIVDALGSLYDAEVHSHKPNWWKKLKSRAADRLMIMFADKILLETAAQKRYFEDRFGKLSKYEVVYTGASSMFAHQAEQGQDSGAFTVLFRGKLTPESGIVHILKAAVILKDEPRIRFKIIGSGYMLERALRLIDEDKLTNVELITRFLADDELVRSMQDADLMLGQFEDNPRLNRTIPHKAFEAFMMGIPYLTADAPAAREAIEDGENGFLVPLANPEALAMKIRSLSREPDRLREVAMCASEQFEKRFSPSASARRIVEIVLQYRDGKD